MTPQAEQYYTSVGDALEIISGGKHAIQAQSDTPAMEYYYWVSSITVTPELTANTYTPQQASSAILSPGHFMRMSFF